MCLKEDHDEPSIHVMISNLHSQTIYYLDLVVNKLHTINYHLLPEKYRPFDTSQNKIGKLLFVTSNIRQDQFFIARRQLNLSETCKSVPNSKETSILSTNSCTCLFKRQFTSTH